MTETTTPLQPTTVEPTKLQPTTPAQPNAPTAPDSPHVTETPSPDHLLTLTDLTRQFVRRGTPFDAVSHVNLTVDAGEFIAIVGRSGNGKSTLINMVAGLIRPTSGTVSVAGRNVADLGDKALSVLRNRTIGFVTQSQTLLGNLTVLDNVILPATMFPEPLPFAQNAEATDAVAQAAATNDEAAADSAATRSCRMSLRQSQPGKHAVKHGCEPFGPVRHPSSHAVHPAWCCRSGRQLPARAVRR